MPPGWLSLSPAAYLVGQMHKLPGGHACLRLVYLRSIDLAIHVRIGLAAAPRGNG